MTNTLENWLQEATRKLSRDSSARVRAEIQDHFQSARQAALTSGASDEDADRRALAALGDAKAANLQYRRVLLTSSEARLLRQGDCEVRAIVSRPVLKWMLMAVPVVALVAAAVFARAGSVDLARVLLAGGVGLSVVLIGPYLPVYTPSRSRIYRLVKNAMLVGMIFFVLDGAKAVGLLIACLWPIIWIESTRFSIRRKLPVAEWPKQLYL